MKKIVVTMMMALGAFASAFGACEYIQKDTAWVYKWKFSGKTTYGTKAKTVKSTGNCGYNGGGQVCSVRCPTSLKIEGYTWVCSPGCGDTFGQFAEVNEVFWSKKPAKFSLAGGVQNEIMHIIGKKAKAGEVAGTVEFDGPDRLYKFTYAGLGKYKNGKLTSASGMFAGLAYPCECAATGYWDCESLKLLCEDTEPTVVYGKWSVKYQKSASKKYANKGVLPKFPSWVRMRNQEEEESGSAGEEEEEEP